MSIFNWISLFDDLNISELSELALFCQERFLRSWELLFEEWDDATAMYIVKSWQLKVYKSRSDGLNILWNVQNGEFVWEMAFFDSNNTSNKRTASVSAIWDTQLLTIMNYSILDLAKKHKNIFDKIAIIIKQRKDNNLNK